ncbi:hypothetical protein OURE66S_01034 [Oligella ureolytica]
MYKEIFDAHKELSNRKDNTADRKYKKYLVI